MKTVSKSAALEKLRVGLVYSMRIGSTLVINLDKVAIDFKEFTGVEFPAEQVFDFQYWRDPDEFNYMKVVKDEENHDL